MRTTIISDAHIGSLQTRHDKLLAMLNNLSCDRLILNGDFFDLWEKSSADIKLDHHNIIDRINQISQSIPIIYIIGNHDTNYSNDLIIGNVVVCNKYEFNDNGKKVIVTHGHQFDTYFWKTINYPLCRLNLFIEKSLGKSIISEPLKSQIDNLREKSSHKYNNYDVVIVGHIHHPECSDIGNVKYVNCGDWKIHYTYVTINNGIVQLVVF